MLFLCFGAIKELYTINLKHTLKICGLQKFCHVSVTFKFEVSVYYIAHFIVMCHNQARITSLKCH